MVFTRFKYYLGILGRMQEKILIDTTRKEEFIDITQKIKEAISKHNVETGLCNIFVRHATAAMVVNENWDPNIQEDFLRLLREKIKDGVWLHDKVDGNGASHLKSSWIGPSITVPISDGKPALGRWQSVMLAEFDGPRRGREIILTIIA